MAHYAQIAQLFADRVPNPQDLITITMRGYAPVLSSRYLRSLFGVDVQYPAWERVFEGNPYNFVIYESWLQEGRLPMGVVETNRGAANGVIEDAGYLKLAELYETACRLDDDHFEDAILDTFLTKLRSLRVIDLPGPTCIAWLYLCLPIEAGRELKRLIIDAYAAEETDEDIGRIASFRGDSRYHDSSLLDLSQFQFELNLAKRKLRRKNCIKTVQFSSQDYHSEPAGPGQL